MAGSRSPFTNPLLKGFDERLPILRAVHYSMTKHAYPKNLNYWWNFGSISGIMLLVMIVTGLFLAMHYKPSVQEDTYGINQAFRSVEHIMRDVKGGMFLRYIHSVGASFFFIAVIFHMFRSLYYGSYKAPRELLWILGCIILILMMAIAFLGYSLVWGVMSFAAAEVITQVFTAIPVLGDDILMLLRGGEDVDDALLNRFFALHFLLPFILAGVVILHILTLQTVGSNNPLGVDIKTKKDTVSFHPYYTFKDIFGLSVFFTIYLAVVAWAPERLAEAINNQPTDYNLPSHIVPEWYLLPFYAILKVFTWDLNIFGLVITGKQLGALAMGGSLGVLFLLPWLDTSPVRSARFRPLYRLAFWGFVLTCVILALVGAQTSGEAFFIPTPIGRIPLGFEAENGFVWGSTQQWGVLFTLYYFGFFIVLMPVLGLFERTRTLPASISEPVLPSSQGGGAIAAAAAAAKPMTKAD